MKKQAHIKPADLKAWRERLGMTQQQAAVALGLERRTLIRYELGERSIPKAVALACAAIALGITTYPPIR
jgi:transcriptional regulator with XRE-family HTH domain